VIGALVDGREAQILEHRHALGEPDRRAEDVDRGVHVILGHARHAIEVDDDGMIGAEALDALDILQRALRREGFGVASGEGGPVFGQQGFCVLALGADGIGQPVLPGANYVGDLALEISDVHLWGRPGEASDDELHAHQRPFGEIGIESGDAAIVGPRKQLADALAHARIVAVTRHVEQSGDEAVEPVDAREQAHARPRLEVENPFAPGVQLLGVDLKQLVARERVENVEQRLAVVAGRGKSGRHQYRLHLVAQQRNLTGRADIGLRCEQPHESDLALRPSIRAVGLDADVVHVRAPMHAARDVGFGDDERRRLEKEAPHLGGHGYQLASAAQHLHLWIAQHAEAAALDRHEVGGIRAAHELARAEKSEVGLLQPLQERDRLRLHFRR
jgi:hypothetical protein